MKIFTNFTIEDQTFLRSNSELLRNEIDGELIILSVQAGEYINLSHIGADIFIFLLNPNTYGQLIQHLMDTYEVSVEQCRKETKSFLTGLLENGIVEIIND